MSEGPQYTSCVEVADFKPLNYWYIGALGVVSVASLFSGIGALIAIPLIVEILRYLLDWMLNGKLICLHRDPVQGCDCGNNGNTICAIGEIADTEEVGEDKNPVEDIDNDYAINLILAPFNIKDFAFEEDAQKNLLKATNSSLPQGDLLKAQPGMPGFSGYFRTMIYTNDGKYNAWTEIVGRDYGYFGIVGPDQQKAWSDYVYANAWLLPKKFSVPVLHCEFEGSRISDMLGVINAFSFGEHWCKKNWFTRFLCFLVQSIFSPFILIGLGIAWANATDGSTEGALQGGGTLTSKDNVIVRGRWTYDGGHSGWNEVHATRIVQKVFYIPETLEEFKKFQLAWCARMGEVPLTNNPDIPPTDPTQRKTFENQKKPQNQWILHPDMDGCNPNTPQDIK